MVCISINYDIASPLIFTHFTLLIAVVADQTHVLDHMIATCCIFLNSNNNKFHSICSSSNVFTTQCMCIL